MALDYVLKPGENLSIAVVDTQTKLPSWKSMHASHPSFKTIVRALKNKNWDRAVRLFDLAQLIADKSQGKVTVKKDGVYYNGTLVDNSLTTRILQMIKEGKPVSNMLKFMDRLYANPQQFAINELFDWLAGSKLPITDDGRFTGYKVVKADYKDIYTGTIDNSPGQMVFMLRTDVCADRHNTCAVGLHFCSGAYVPSYGVTSGNDYRVIQLAIDPADVVAIPTDYNFTKGRTWRYEVIKEVPKDQVRRLVDQGIDIDDYRTAVYSIAKDSKKLRADILALPTIKSMLRKAASVKKVKRGRKAKNTPFIVTKQSIGKMTYGRLVNLYKQFAPPEPPTVSAAGFYNPQTEYNRLWEIRASYGFTRGQIAEKAGVDYSTIYRWEISQVLHQEYIDRYIAAVLVLNGVRNSKRGGVSVPAQQAKAAAAGAAGVDEFGYEVMESF
jgi:DNA-binding XRE family transcriptional regulator